MNFRWIKHSYDSEDGIVLYYLCENEEYMYRPIAWIRGPLDVNNIDDYRKRDVGDIVAITREEYEWVLNHPEQYYMEILL